MKTQTTFVLDEDERNRLKDAVDVLENIRAIAGNSREGDILDDRETIVSTYSDLRDIISVLEIFGSDEEFLVK